VGSETATLLDVTGNTALYLVIGDPIAQVLSTRLYNRLSAEAGADCVFAPYQFAAENFDVAVAGLKAIKNLRGVIPTIPHKPKMYATVDDASERASMLRIVNAIRVEPDGRWFGEMLDGVGCVNGLEANDVPPAGKSVLLVGAGGAGASIAYELAERGAASLRIAELDPAKAQRALEIAKAKAPDMDVSITDADPRSADLIVNATPLGMKSDDPLPVDPEKLVSDQTVMDMIMKPPVTPLLKAAQAKGCRTVRGHEALMGQSEPNMRFFGLMTDAMR